jgi:hypothetical protein
MLFAKFVSESEELYQVDDLFSDIESKEKYKEIWFELEIINGLALSEWEEQGRPVDWNTQWESSYRSEASDLVNDLINTLK